MGEEIAEKLDKLKLENEILTEEAKAAEMRAMIKELKAKYGSGWRKILNIRDNEDVKAFAGVRFKLM